ncbi:MAG TPA: hydrogenase maturation protease [Anaeromyxobacteraceae bacterium]|nr:hydrogenase maturation protease [Anaeromyxobacteraceae bacterium]
MGPHGGEGASGRPALVVALGSPLRGDDGAASAALAGLELEGLTVKVVQALLPELALEVAEARVVVFVDARAGAPAGEVRSEGLEPAAFASGLLHALSPAAVLALGKALYGRAPEAFLVTVNGSEFGFGERLSPAVEKALPDLRRRVSDLVRKAGAP